MFTTHHHVNTALINQNIVSEIYQDALDKVTHLTGLNIQECDSLFQELHQSLQQRHSYGSQVENTPIISHNEHQFISSLFN